MESISRKGPIYHFLAGDHVRLGALLQHAYQGRLKREDVVAAPEGIWMCTFVGECTRVCPKDVDPAGAIQRAKLATALDWGRLFCFRGAKPVEVFFHWRSKMTIKIPVPLKVEHEELHAELVSIRQRSWSAST